MYSKNDPLTLSVALSRWSMVPAVCMIVCPTLGGRLAAINPRLPFAAAALLAAAMGALYATALAEPMDPSLRKPFRWGAGLSPLSWLALFRRGTTMRSLAVIQMLMDFTETS